MFPFKSVKSPRPSTWTAEHFSQIFHSLHSLKAVTETADCICFFSDRMEIKTKALISCLPFPLEMPFQCFSHLRPIFSRHIHHRTSCAYTCLHFIDCIVSLCATSCWRISFRASEQMSMWAPTCGTPMWVPCRGKINHIYAYMGLKKTYSAQVCKQFYVLLHPKICPN